MQGLHRMYLFVTLDLPKELDLLLDPLHSTCRIGFSILQYKSSVEMFSQGDLMYLLALNVQIMLTCHNNTAATDQLFSTYYVFNKILFDYFEPYHQNLPEPEVEQKHTLLTLDTPSYDLPSLNIRILDKPLSSHILDKNSGPIYCEMEHTITNMLENQATDFNCKGEFLWLQRDILTCIKVSIKLHSGREWNWSDL